MKLCYSASEEDEQEVRIELSAFAIDNAPPYAAISYTWGDQPTVQVFSSTGEPIPWSSTAGMPSYK